jgi:hypothetical protein
MPQNLIVRCLYFVIRLLRPDTIALRNEGYEDSAADYNLTFQLLPPAQTVSSGSNQPSASVESLNLTPAEIASLVNECGERTTQMTRRIFDYTYTLTALENEVDKRGQVTRENRRSTKCLRFESGARASSPGYR